MSAQRPTASLHEVLLASLALALVAALAYAPHLIHGGFYFDDWASAAATLRPNAGPGLANVLSSFEALFPYRPVLILYVPLINYIFGTDMALQLAWAIALAVIVVSFLYAILRLFYVPWYHAWVICALAVVYPGFDSARLWESASLSSLSIALTLGAFLIAIAGLERRSWFIHGIAVSLYVVSILTYEITLPMIAALGSLYVVRFGWPLARSRWGVDLLAVLAAGLWNVLHSTRIASGISGDIDHMSKIVTSGTTVLGWAAFPVGEIPRTTFTLGVLAVVLGVGLAVYLVLGVKRDRESRWGLREWLLLSAGGLSLAALGWLVFIPGDPYYTPSVLGSTNRVNALAGFGLVIAVYAGIGTGMALIGRAMPVLGKWTAAITVAFGLVLGAAYTHVLERHIGVWDAAFHAETVAIEQVKRQFPKLPPGTTIFTSDYPANQAPGVPIFTSTWDLNGMIKLEYEDRTLSAYPLYPGLELACRRGGVGLRGVGAPQEVAAYGSARLLDLQSGRRYRPRGRAECRAVADQYVAGPQYVSNAY